ncbi:hypothetical protein [Amaricoccus macauensis]|uniref:hypothetical protein n=1 Tax=Amaricoccus macauensis TaxID=57001 RepID=UPI003C7D61C8
MKHWLAVTAFSLLAAPASAGELEALVQDYVAAHVTAWVADPVLVEAVKAQNEKHAAITQDDIDDLDATWRKEVDAGSAPLVTEVLESPASDFLRDRKSESEGIISEAFVMDAVGLNVAASDATSDFWQGDEAKFQKTYPEGPGTVFVDDVEFDDSTQTYQSQVSFTIADPESGEAIGAITVGIDLDALL